MKPRHAIATSVLGALVIALIAVIGLGALPLGPDASPERPAPEPAPLTVEPVAAAAVPGHPAPAEAAPAPIAPAAADARPLPRPAGAAPAGRPAPQVAAADERAGSGPDDQRGRCHDRDGRQQAARDDRRGAGPRGDGPRGGGGSA